MSNAENSERKQINSEQANSFSFSFLLLQLGFRTQHPPISELLALAQLNIDLRAARSRSRSTQHRPKPELLALAHAQQQHRPKSEHRLSLKLNSISTQLRAPPLAHAQRNIHTAISTQHSQSYEHPWSLTLNEYQFTSTASSTQHSHS